MEGSGGAMERWKGKGGGKVAAEWEGWRGESEWRKGGCRERRGDRGGEGRRESTGGG